MQPIYGYGGRAVATFASPEGMKDCFYVPDPFVDLKNVRILVISAECITLKSLPVGPAWRLVQTSCLHVDPLD